jgi:hypothetical protein
LRCAGRSSPASPSARTLDRSLPAEDASGRLEHWRSLADHALLEKRSTERGVSLRFFGAPPVLATLTALVELERECCAWVTWEITTSPDGIWLEASAAPGRLLRQGDVRGVATGGRSAVISGLLLPSVRLRSSSSARSEF